MQQVDGKRDAAEEIEERKRQDAAGVAREEDARHQNGHADVDPVAADVLDGLFGRGGEPDLFHGGGPGHPFVVVLRVAADEEADDD